MSIVRGQFDKLLRPGARKVFIDDYNELPSTYNQLLNVETSGKAFEDDLVATGLPAAVSKSEGEPISFDRAVFRGRVRYIHAGYGLGYEITREAVEDDQYSALNSQGASNLARSMRAAEEVTAANVFNNSFSSVTAYDGVALCATTHTSAHTGVTFANKPSSDADIAVATLKASTERFMNLKTDRSLRIDMMPSTVLTGNASHWTVQEILGTKVVTGASSGGETDGVISAEAKNVVTQMGLMPVRWAYITDDNAWWTLAPKGVHRLNFFWRTKPTTVSGTDERAGVAWFGIHGRWVAGATDWRGIDGSSGA